MSKLVNLSTSKKIKIYQAASLVVYLLVILLASTILIIEPNNFDAKTLIVPLIVLLVLSSIGIGRKIAGNGESKIVSNLGTIALTILFTFIGFFIVAGVAWFIGISHVS